MQRTKILYKIGDKMRIRVIRADKVSRQIDFEKIDEKEEVESTATE